MDLKKPSKLVQFIRSFNFYNVLSFYVIWYLCILGASFHFERTAIVLSIFLVLVHFFFSSKKQLDLVYLAVLFLVGYGVDLVFLRFSILTYPADTLIWNISGVPLWILMLYVGFSTTLNHSLLFINQHAFLSFVFGSIGGAFCYALAGYRGVVDFPLGFFSVAIVGIYWGSLMAVAGPFQKIISKRFH